MAVIYQKRCKLIKNVLILKIFSEENEEDKKLYLQSNENFMQFMERAYFYL
jgi:hypothetical protein